jgi:membrane protease subunit HflC
VILFDKRVLDFEPPPEEVIVADQKRLVVDSYTRYKIISALTFYKSVGTEAVARSRLGALVNGSLRRVLGNVTVSAILSQERSNIMRQIRDEVSAQAKAFGIEVIDVRLRRADLPEENSQAIFARMQSEREREAREFRAEGAAAAQRIRSTAERERTVTLAQAQKKGQILRGDGDAESIRIYAEAFGQDREFFAFYRSMQAYREALNGRDTSFVMRPEGGFFQFFGGWTGEGRPAAGQAPANAAPAEPPRQ